MREILNHWRGLFREGVLKKAPIDSLNPHEKYHFSDTLYLQATPDKSEGADVILTDPEMLIIVDGKESGRDGDRDGAEELMKKLKTGEVSVDITPLYPFIKVTISNDMAKLHARGSTVGIVWELDETGSRKHKILHFAQDSFPDDQRPVTLTNEGIDLSKCRFLMMMSDGGIDLLGNRALFGNHPDYFRGSTNIAENIAYQKYNDEDIGGALDKLLRPIDAILQLKFFIPELSLAEINRYFHKFQVAYDVGGPHQVPDDATIIFTSISGN